MEELIKLIKDKILREEMELGESIKYILKLKDEIRQMAKGSPSD